MTGNQPARPTRLMLRACMLGVVFSLAMTAPAAAEMIAITRHPANHRFNNTLRLFSTETGEFATLAAPSTGAGSSFESASWSNDGEQLTFEGVAQRAVSTGGSTRAAFHEIWMASADGSERRRLTSGHYDFAPRFSDNGKWIVFARRYPSHSGKGCSRGGRAATRVSTRTGSIKRISACFHNELIRGGIWFFDGDRRVAFVGPNRKHVSTVRAGGADAARAIPRVLYKTPKDKDALMIAGALPQLRALWIVFEDDSGVLAPTDGGRATKLPYDAFDLSPNGRTVVKNCRAAPSAGLCLQNTGQRTLTKLLSPFTAAFNQDSAEFGFDFSGSSRSLASFGFGSNDASNGTSDLQLCVRATLAEMPTCRSLPDSATVKYDAGSPAALWQPRPSGG